ncbi:MAG: heavy metal efflux system protein, partial [Frankiales bacterium]|nr:heavy metal efflux system protein [Frankiales bacterium]
LRNPLLVIVAWLGVAIAGVVGFARLPIDAFPDTTPVQVQVNTVAPALSPLEIERQITARVEQGISGLPDLVEVRSLSRFGLSQVTVAFADGTDIYRARQVVSERLRGVRLPVGVGAPTLGPVATGLGEVFHYVVTGDGVSASELRTAQDWIVKPQLAAVPGVAEVNSWGGEERQVQVIVDPAALQSRRLTLADLAEALDRNNLNVGGGTIEVAGEASIVQGVALLTRPGDVEQVVITAKDGVPVRVRDVARVVDGHEIRRGAVTADGKGEVVLGLGFLLIGENSHDVTARLAARLSEIRKSLPAGIEVAPVYQRTTLVEQVLETVRRNLLEGAILVIAVLFVFLGNVRAGLIVAAAIPLSMLFAFDLMVRAGVAGSLMSLGAIDFGLIVDSSVISVENSVRRLAEDRSSRSRVDVVREATLEVRRPTMFGELVILIVYLPILFLEGVEGKLFRPMALASARAVPGALDVGRRRVLLVGVVGEERRQQVEQVRHGQGVAVAGLAGAGRLDVAVDVERRAPPGGVGREEVVGDEPLTDPGHDVAVGVVDGVEVRLLVDELLDDAQVGQGHRHLLEHGAVPHQVEPLAAQRREEGRHRLADPAPEAGPALGRPGERDLVAEPLVGGGEGVELVGQADVRGQAEAPPQGDRLRVPGGQQLPGQGDQGRHAGARGQEDQLTVLEPGRHGAARRPPEQHLVARPEVGEVERHWPVGDSPHHQVEERGLGRVGEDAVGAAPEAAAVELGLDADELAGDELEGLAVDHLEPEAERARRGERHHRRHPGPALEPAGPEPVVVEGVHGRHLGGVRAAPRRRALEVPRTQPDAGLLAALALDQTPRLVHRPSPCPGGIGVIGILGTKREFPRRYPDRLWIWPPTH